MIKLLEGREANKFHIDSDESAVVIGMQRKSIAFTPVRLLVETTDMEHRLPGDQWWMKLRCLMRILAKHETVYVSEVLKKDYSEDEEDMDDVLDA